MDDEPADITTWEQLGYPKPANNPPSKAAIRDAYRAMVMPQLAPIIDAQIAKAKGVKHLVVRMPDGKFKRIGEMTPESLDAVLAEGGERVEIWLRDPDMSATTDLLNRTMDKPKEQEQEVIVHDGDKILARLDAWKLANRRDA